MALRNKIISGKLFLEQLLANKEQYSLNSKEECLQFLILFFDNIRPAKNKSKNTAEANLESIISVLEDKPFIAMKLQQAITTLLVDASLEASFTRSGIPLSGDFWGELIKRVKHKILPEELDDNDFLYIINSIFYGPKDYLWVNAIKRSTWIHFFELLQFPLQASDKKLRDHLMDALIILSIQVANNGLQKEITRFTSPVSSRQQDPFIVQRRLLLELQQQLNHNPADIKTEANSLRIVLHQLENEIDYIRQHQGSKGTSIKQNYSLLILGTRLKRMLILLDTLDNDDSFDMGMFVDMFKIIVQNEKRKTSILEFISQASGHIAYQIAEHKGLKGGKYITATRREYFNMILSAMGGGAIICVVVLIKFFIGKLHFAHFWQGFWYSINYSVGFISIDQSGSTLATKQPAFTANAVAVSLDSKKNNANPDLNNLAVTVAKVVRSQAASFIGNLIIVLPGTYLLAWIYHIIMGAKLVSGKAALQLLQDQHPFQSLSLLYACNTGAFLFLSGIIAGYVQNKIRFSHIANRIAGNPAYHLHSSNRRRNVWARFIEKNAGSLAGNISLGFFLGMAAPIGKIFGIPFDIRHITISSGNMGLGVYGLGFENIPLSYLLTVFFGVLGIGFFNFLISFSLAFFVAVKARGIKLRQYPEFIGILARYFIRRPLSFIFPPKIAG